MVRREQTTYIVRYPALKAFVDALIAQGYGDWAIHTRVKEHRPAFERVPHAETIGMYRKYLAEQKGAQAQPDVPVQRAPARPVMGRREHVNANPMERAPAGQARNEYLTLIEMLGFAAVVLLPHLVQAFL